LTARDLAAFGIAAITVLVFFSTIGKAAVQMEDQQDILIYFTALACSLQLLR
jgi:hypothetical protein